MGVENYRGVVEQGVGTWRGKKRFTLSPTRAPPQQPTPKVNDALEAYSFKRVEVKRSPMSFSMRMRFSLEGQLLSKTFASFATASSRKGRSGKLQQSTA